MVFFPAGSGPGVGAGGDTAGAVWHMPTSLVLASGSVAFAMAWAIGAQDVSNALGTSVGSKALTVKQAIVVGAVFEFLGSLVGGDVAATISGGILNLDEFQGDGTAGVELYARCMFCTMFGAFLWLAVATYYSLPVSTTHSLVGALVGVGLTAKSTDGLQWDKVGTIVSSWVTSPIMGGVISFAIFKTIWSSVLSQPEPAKAAQRMAPIYSAVTAGILCTFLGLTGPKAYRIGASAAVMLGVVVTCVGLVLSKMIGKGDSASTTVLPSHADGGHGDDGVGGGSSADAGAGAATDDDAHLRSQLPVLTGAEAEKGGAERAFTTLMVVTACVVSFAHGSNDVSNSIGPFNAMVEIYAHGKIDPSSAVPTWVLIAGGVGIVIGLATYGHKVMATVGQKIATLTFARGYAAQIGTALTVLTATQLGVSVSTTHCLIGAISGVALVEGRDKLNSGTLKRIVVSWVVTIPAAALFSVALYGILALLF